LRGVYYLYDVKQTKTNTLSMCEVMDKDTIKIRNSSAFVCGKVWIGLKISEKFQKLLSCD
jgi:hypothetical protein